MPMNNVASTHVNHAAVNAANTGDNTLIAAVAGKRIRVVSYALVASAAMTVIIRDLTANTERARFPLAANSGVSYPGVTAAFETAVGEGLELNTSAAGFVGGHITYQLVA
jgi:hypothetical protein